jgi:hypothetical protein
LQADYAPDGQRFVTLKELSSEFSAEPSPSEHPHQGHKKNQPDGSSRLADESAQFGGD